MISQELMENITNYLFVFLLMLTGILISLSDAAFYLVSKTTEYSGLTDRNIKARQL